MPRLDPFNPLLLAVLALAPALAAAQPQLLPAPREAHFSGETIVSGSIAVTVPGHDAEDEFAAADLREAARTIAHGQSTSPYRVVLLRAASS